MGSKTSKSVDISNGDGKAGKSKATKANGHTNGSANGTAVAAAGVVADKLIEETREQLDQLNTSDKKEEDNVAVVDEKAPEVENVVQAQVEPTPADAVPEKPAVPTTPVPAEPEPTPEVVPVPDVVKHEGCKCDNCQCNPCNCADKAACEIQADQQPPVVAAVETENDVQDKSNDDHQPQEKVVEPEAVEEHHHQAESKPEVTKAADHEQQSQEPEAVKSEESHHEQENHSHEQHEHAVQHSQEQHDATDGHEHNTCHQEQASEISPPQSEEHHDFNHDQQVEVHQ